LQRWRRRRRFRTAGTLKAENGDERESDNVTSCQPLEWQIAKQAFSPLSTHCSWRVIKLSLETAAWPDESVAGSGLRVCVRTPSLTMLAHKGAAQEIEVSAGSERWCCCCWSFNPLSRLPSTPTEGEAGWWGEVHVQPHEEGRRHGRRRCAVGWLILLTVLPPPRVERECHPHHLRWMVRRQVS
jgi:hypothetical protein